MKLVRGEKIELFFISMYCLSLVDHTIPVWLSVQVIIIDRTRQAANIRIPRDQVVSCACVWSTLRGQVPFSSWPLRTNDVSSRDSAVKPLL